MPSAFTSGTTRPDELQFERNPKVIDTMMNAACAIEACAFGLAGHIDTFTVSRLVLMAAEIEKLTDRLTKELDGKLDDIEVELRVQDSHLADLNS